MHATKICDGSGDVCLGLTATAKRPSLASRSRIVSDRGFGTLEKEMAAGMTDGVFRPAIEALLQSLAEQEKKVIETKTLINRLCAEAGEPPLFADVGEVSKIGVANIRSDTFYGKPLPTAIREYLEMRRAANLGPAETREIYEALIKGGYQFDAADANNAMTGMRAMMRKSSSMFHRLPNQAWGLTAWYEKIKTKNAQASDDED